jgi:hypothetical protein
MLSSAETYIPGGKTIRKGLLGGRPSAAAPPKLEDVRLEQKDVNSIQDTVWTVSNQAQSRLLKRTGQPAIAAKMEADMKRDQRERVIVKQKRPPKKVLAPPAPTLGADAAAAAAAAKGADKQFSWEEKRQETELVPTPMVLDPKVSTLEQHKRRDKDTALYAVIVERPSRATTEEIVKTPPAHAVLGYCAEYKPSVPWYLHMQEVVADSPDLQYQRVPVFRRSVLVTFLRAPDPAVPYERPCYNLDREPFTHETLVRCIGHRLSEAKLGADRAFRPRELLFNDQSVKINAALASGGNCKQDPCVYLRDPPEMCYMCHVWLTTEMALNQQHNADIRDCKDMTVAAAAPVPVKRILNAFMVDVGKLGEYDVRKMLVSAGVSLGIWGPFPLWNARNYIPVRVSTSGTQLWGFEESEDLLFRLPRVPLQVIECSSQSDSIPSNPTPVAQAGLKSRR